MSYKFIERRGITFVTCRDLLRYLLHLYTFAYPFVIFPIFKKYENCIQFNKGIPEIAQQKKVEKTVEKKYFNFLQLFFVIQKFIVLLHSNLLGT
jgi:hypothetical protein